MNVISFVLCYYVSKNRIKISIIDITAPVNILLSGAAQTGKGRKQLVGARLCIGYLSELFLKIRSGQSLTEWPADQKARRPELYDVLFVHIQDIGNLRLGDAALGGNLSGAHPLGAQTLEILPRLQGRRVHLSSVPAQRA